MNKEMKLGIYKFIKEVNHDYTVKFQKYDLECNVFDEIIYVGETYDKRTDLYFKNFVNKLNPECRKINRFLLSLLHEIGHIETYTDELSDEKRGIAAIKDNEGKWFIDELTPLFTEDRDYINRLVYPESDD